MSTLLRPHSREWFDALFETSPQQAKYTAHIIHMAGSEAVCSVCGDVGSVDYVMQGREYAPGVQATIRLCLECKKVRERGMPDALTPMQSGDRRTLHDLQSKSH